jgi:hypothetical protein
MTLSWGLSFIIITSYCLLAVQNDLRLAVPALIGIAALVIACLSLILYLAEKEAIHFSPGAILAVAAILRLLFLFRQPELSDDIYRYLWDGLRFLSGHNPYTLAPVDLRPPGEALSWLAQRVNHPELVTIYPPAAQYLFAMGAALHGGVAGIKAFLIVLDLASCVLIVRLLSALGQPPSRAVLYAWHPLPVLEIAASGHIDGAGVFFFVLTLVLIIKASAFSFKTAIPMGSSRHRWVPLPHSDLIVPAAGLAFACAVLVKFLPLMFLPGCLILLGLRNSMIFCTAMAAGIGVLCLPFLPQIQNELITLGRYLHHWEFAGFAFRILRDMTSSGNQARILLGSSFFLTMAYVTGRQALSRLKLEEAKEVSGQGLRTPINNPLPEHRNGPAFAPAFQGFYIIALSYLLLTPTLYPWYALYLACLLPFAVRPAGLAISWSVLLSYTVVMRYAILGNWVEDDVVPFMIWTAPFAAYIAAASTSLLCKRKTAATEAE